MRWREASFRKPVKFTLELGAIACDTMLRLPCSTQCSLQVIPCIQELRSVGLGRHPACAAGARQRGGAVRLPHAAAHAQHRRRGERSPEAGAAR